MGTSIDNYNQTYFMSFRSPKAFHFFLVLILTWSYLSLSVQAQETDPWPGFRNTPANTGATTNLGPPFPDPLWRFNTTGFTYSSPAVTENAIYIASESELIALDLEGNELWAVPLTDSEANIEGVEISGIVSSPVVSNSGIIYVGSLDNHLYAINPDGTIRWREDMFDQVFGSPVIGPDDIIYAASRSGLVLAINAEQTIQWTQLYSTEFFSSPALGPDGLLYIGGTDNALYALDTNNLGAFEWSTGPIIQEEIVSSPTVFNGVVYVGATDNNFYAFNASSGAPVWAQPFQGSDVFVSSPAIGVDNGAVYTASFDGTVYAINRANGTLRWSYDTGELIAASPAIDGNGHIFITTLEGTLFVLADAGSQATVRWTYALGAPAWASPAIGNGNALYVAASGSQTTPGRLIAIGPSEYEVDLVPGTPIAGEDLSVTIRLAGTQTGANVTFFYRSAGETTYNSLPITASGTINGSDITGEGFEYYIEGPQGSFPSRSPQSRPATRPVFVQRIASGLDIIPRRYKMVSIPFDLSDTSISSVLDEFGPYSPASWRLLRWNGIDYVEYPNFEESFTPGTAFFLITSSDSTFSIENATSVNTSEPFSIELPPGWSQVGNPFGFPVAWNNVIRNTALVNSIAFYNGIEMIQDPEAVNELLPWNGYFVYNADTENTAIQIQPIPAAGNVPGKRPDQSPRLQLIASLDGTDLQDSQNWIGFHPEATGGRDGIDVREAPPFGEEYIRLSLGSMEEPLALAYNPLTQQGSEWSLYLSASTTEALTQSQEISLSFVKNDQFPEDFELALIDEDHGFAQRISSGAASIQWDASREVRSLKLIAGTQEYINSRIQSIPLAPETFLLEQNFPNPFQQQTAIRYQINRRSDVSLVVYNTLGQEIQTLVQSVQSPGTFEAIWDGKDTQGRTAPSGIYFYRLLADDLQATGRMTLIR